MNVKKIGVHDGCFHADDVFAVATLKLIFPKAEVVRSRDPDVLKKCDVRLDVGMKYDPKRGDFDHHQGEMKETRKNGIPYASFGLVWKNFGRKIVGNKKVWEYIDRRIVQPIDADDTAYEICEAKIEPHTTSRIIDLFNPDWLHRDRVSYDKEFFEVLPLAKTILQKEIQKAKGVIKAEDIVRKEIRKQNAEKKGFLFLRENIPWKRVVVSETKNVKYVISYNKGYRTWGVETVPVKLTGFKNRKDLPREWGGLTGEKLASVTGIKDVVFCHKALFVVAARSRESALELARKSLEY